MIPLLFILAAPAAPYSITTTADAEATPTRFRLEAATFEVKTTPKYTLPVSGVEISSITFPSPVTSQHVENNTVTGELFRPMNITGKVPAVLVLDIMQGNGVVSRGQAMWFASHGIAAIVIDMAYYGPRRPPGTRLKMIMPDIEHSVAAVTQSVLDGRRAIAFLKQQPFVDDTRIGVIGTSLGSFIGGLIAASDSNVSRAALLLGGGALVDSFLDHPKSALLKSMNELLGGTKDNFKKLIDPIDPITYADQLKRKKLLLFAANRDDVVPPQAMKRLWEATGQPRILWVDGNHVGGALYIFPAMAAAMETFRD